LEAGRAGVLLRGPGAVVWPCGGLGVRVPPSRSVGVGLGDGGEAWPLGGVALVREVGPRVGKSGMQCKHVFRVATWSAGAGRGEARHGNGVTRTGVPERSDDVEIANTLRQKKKGTTLF
jgi:hypothetical protein